MALSRLLTTEELAEYLNAGHEGEQKFSVRTLEFWRRKGKGPKFVRIGGHVRYRESAVNAWLDRVERDLAAEAEIKAAREVAA